MLKFRVINIIFFTTLALLAIYNLTAPVPIVVYFTLIFIYITVLAYGSAVLSAQFFLPVKFKGDHRSNSIALTFDDGPHPGHTEQILETLKLHGVSATFFCIGHRVMEYPQLVKQIHQAGHLIGNHSYWHGHGFDLQSTSTISRELEDTSEVIKKTTGVWPNFFRPPYGVTNPMVARAIKNGGYQAIGWSLRSFDLRIRESKVLLRRITKSIKSGDVILFHDRSDTTVEILPVLLEHVSGLGLKVVRLDELLNEEAYV